ncbi:hypothetical protein [Exiguobacterium aurantiacum]|uniref:Uncharacterized protein n=1 Tax=Exiguobacterium aurantiacum TaxID=33987 RepID=A0A377FTA7_9BACL|nr:hypothetical protein [Exiguobacterium aurantiacum]STO07988.1 Uncharacterised protein [Exiguobacterium aurantiacum]
MAIIENESLFFELFPRKYSEKHEDPFISSTLGIGIDGKGVFHFYGELLMKSEFEEILSNIEEILSNIYMMLKDEINNFIFIPVEPIFKMQVIKETLTLYCWIFKFQTGKPREHRFYTNKTEVQTFYLQLKEEMNNVLPPPFLPK